MNDASSAQAGRKKAFPSFLLNQSDIPFCKRLVKSSADTLKAASRIEDYNQFKPVLAEISSKAKMLSLRKNIGESLFACLSFHTTILPLHRILVNEPKNSQVMIDPQSLLTGDFSSIEKCNVFGSLVQSYIRFTQSLGIRVELAKTIADVIVENFAPDFVLTLSDILLRDILATGKREKGSETLIKGESMSELAYRAYNPMKFPTGEYLNKVILLLQFLDSVPGIFSGLVLNDFKKQQRSRVWTELDHEILFPILLTVGYPDASIRDLSSSVLKKFMENVPNTRQIKSLMYESLGIIINFQQIEQSSRSKMLSQKNYITERGGVNILLPAAVISKGFSVLDSRVDDDQNLSAIHLENFWNVLHDTLKLLDFSSQITPYRYVLNAMISLLEFGRLTDRQAKTAILFEEFDKRLDIFGKKKKKRVTQYLYAASKVVDTTAGQSAQTGATLPFEDLSPFRIQKEDIISVQTRKSIVDLSVPTTGESLAENTGFELIQIHSLVRDEFKRFLRVAGEWISRDWNTYFRKVLLWLDQLQRSKEMYLRELSLIKTELVLEQRLDVYEDRIRFEVLKALVNFLDPAVVGDHSKNSLFYQIVSECRRDSPSKHIFRSVLLLSQRVPSDVLDGLVISCVLPKISALFKEIYVKGNTFDDNSEKLSDLLRFFAKYRFRRVSLFYEFSRGVLLKRLESRTVKDATVRLLIISSLKHAIEAGMDDDKNKVQCSVIAKRLLNVALSEPDAGLRLEVLRTVKMMPEIFLSGLQRLDLFLEDADDRIRVATYKLISRLSNLGVPEAVAVASQRLNQFIEDLATQERGVDASKTRKRAALMDLKFLNIILEYGNPSIFRGYKGRLLVVLTSSFDLFSSYSGKYNKLLLKAINKLGKARSDFGGSSEMIDTIKIIIDRFLANFRKTKMTYNELKYSLIALKNLIRGSKLVIAVYHFRPILYDIAKEILSDYPHLDLYASDLLSTIGAVDPEEIEEINNWLEKEALRRVQVEVEKNHTKYFMLTKKEEKLLSKLKMHKKFRKIPKYELDIRFSYPPTVSTLGYYSQVKALSTILNFLGMPKHYGIKLEFSKRLKMFLKNFIPNEEERKEHILSKLTFPILVSLSKKLLVKLQKPNLSIQKERALVALINSYLKNFVYLIRISREVSVVYFYKILRVVVGCWNYDSLLPSSVAVLRELCAFEEFHDDITRTVLPVFLPEMANLLQAFGKMENEDVFLTILEILDITDISSTYSDLIIPPLLNLLSKVFSSREPWGKMELEISIRIIKILFEMALTKDIFKQVFTILEHILRIQGSIDTYKEHLGIRMFVKYFLELVSVRFPISDSLLPYLEMLMISNNLYGNSETAKIFSSTTKRTVENISKDFMNLYNKSKEGFLGRSADYDGLVEATSIDFHEIISAMNKKDSVPWDKWMVKIKNKMLENSPKISIRICSELSKFEPKVAEDLFELSFFTIWNELTNEDRKTLVSQIRQNVFQKDTPRDILVEFLDLIGYIEMCDPENSMGFDNSELFKIAESCKAYGKALRYKELDYQESFSNQKLGELIRINSKLMLKDSAKGLLQIAARELEFEISVGWLEELQEWKKVLEEYNKMERSFSVDKKRLECCRVLGDWRQLNVIIDDVWKDLSYEQRVEIADKAVRGAWFNKDLDKMTEYIRYIPDDMNGNFLKSIYHILTEDYKAAKTNIQRTKKLAVQEFRSLKHSKMVQKTVQDGSYESYAMLVALQQLGELEEIIKYKKGKIDLEDLKILWQRRLFGTHQSVSVWQDILSVHEILFSSVEQSSTYSKYIKICHKNGNQDLANYTLKRLVKDAGFRVVEDSDSFVVSRREEDGFWESVNRHPKTYYSYLKYKFLSGQRKEAIHGLGLLIDNSDHKKHSIDFRAKMMLKYAKWALKEFDNLGEYGISPSEIDMKISEAIQIDDRWAKSYRLYSDFYLRAAEKDPESRPELLGFAVANMIHSISNSVDGGNIHELLRLLTTWFNYYEIQEVFYTFRDEYPKIPLIAWINVTPQLLSRLHYHEGHVKELLREILSNVAIAFPQALIFPVTVSRSNRDHQNNIDPTNHRPNEAKVILDEMRIKFPTLVESAETVAVDLLRVSILWQEIWDGGLDEFKYLFKRGDYEGLKATVSSLYEMVKKGGETKLEREFLERYKVNIEHGYRYIKKIIGARVSASRQKQVIKKSWKYFSVLHKGVREEISRLKSFRLEDASVALPKINSSSGLAVPGTYKPNKKTIFIEQFDDYVEVVRSKQRPRKIRIKASNGETFQYLLKGHEDLRQDERVMQVVELINNLIMTNPRLKRMKIQKFPVIPLSFNSGLIGWIKDSKTIHRLVLERRVWKESSIGSEHKRITEFCPNYNELCRIAKVEARNYGMEGEDGNDIADVLWVKSKRNEEWISKRVMYTSSLSTMSMVGYILGLGDRHPNNLMMTESTGKISHIDFGDCFEVAMERKTLAEKVPFRLTRMLIHGMGIPGENGMFRSNSENVMEILRKNKEQISTILEAHVYDPLIQWVFEKKDRLIRVESERNIDRGQMMNAKERKRNKQELNKKALQILGRVKDKLSGSDFGTETPLTVEEQVGRLIEQASDPYNISAHYIGWCPFW